MITKSGWVFLAGTILVISLSVESQAQRRPPTAAQVESLRKHSELVSQQPMDGMFNQFDMKIGQQGSMENFVAKVSQVLGKDSMLITFDTSRNKGPHEKHNYTVVLKAPTKGIVDGKWWIHGSGWEEVIGTRKCKVTDTQTLNLAGGGTKTVFVLEPIK